MAAWPRCLRRAAGAAAGAAGAAGIAGLRPAHAAAHPVGAEAGREGAAGSDGGGGGAAPPAVPRGGGVWGVRWNHDWDGRQAGARRLARLQKGGDEALKKMADGAADAPASCVAVVPAPYRRVILVRHGQYQNELLCDTDDGACTLSMKGREQAAATGRWLRGMMDAGQLIRSIVASDLTRAKQTAVIIAQETGHDVSYDARLREGFPCRPEPDIPDWTNAIPEEDREREPLVMEEAFQNHVGPRLLGEERQVASAEAARAVLREQEARRAEEIVDVVVCHGNVIRFFVCRALQAPPERWLGLGVGNGSMTTFRVSPRSGVPAVLGVGEQAHIPHNLRTQGNLRGPDPALKDAASGASA